MFNLRSPRRQVLEFLVLFILLLTSCSGVAVEPQGVVGTQTTTALWVIKEAINGSTQSIRMASPSNGMWLFARYIPETETWAFTSVDMAAKDILGKWLFCGGGNLTSCGGMSDLVAGLIDREWMFKDVGSLPPGFAEAVAAAGGWVSRIQTVPALIIPAGSFEILPYILGVQENDT